MGMMTMRILVTGGAGFIGSHFVRLLLRRGDTEVINLDALRYSGNLENLRDVERHPRYTFIHGDICDRALVDRVAREHRVEAIVNLAAETHVDRSILEPDGFVKTDVVEPPCSSRRLGRWASNDSSRSAQTKCTAISLVDGLRRRTPWPRAARTPPARRPAICL